MKFVRLGVLSPDDLPPVSGPSSDIVAQALPLLVQLGTSERALEFKGVELMFLGCHGGEAGAETELVKAAVAKRVVVKQLSVCDVCITKNAHRRVAALGFEGSFIFHPAHALEYLHYLRTIGLCTSRYIIVVSLQPIPFEDYDDLLVYHRLLSALGDEIMVHKEILIARDGNVQLVDFHAHALTLLEQFTAAVMMPQRCTDEGRSEGS